MAIGEDKASIWHLDMLFPRLGASTLTAIIGPFFAAPRAILFSKGQNIVKMREKYVN